MSAHGSGPFENDGALDLCEELQELDVEGAHDLIAETLTSLAEGDEESTKDEGEAVVAAAAMIVARMTGDSAQLVFREIDAAVPPDLSDLREVAVRALERVLGPGSELAGTWEDMFNEPQWRASVQGLIDTLRG
jgi:Domain of unknown function (DUF4259)